MFTRTLATAPPRFKRPPSRWERGAHFPRVPLEVPEHRQPWVETSSSSGTSSQSSHERLVFEAVSRPGTGKLILTSGGSGDRELLRMAQVAMEWATVNKQVIQEDFGLRRGPAMLSGSRDVHVNVANLLKGGTKVLRLYSPAIAVAITSLATGRLPQQHVAMLGDLDTTDNFYQSLVAVKEPRHVDSLYAQGFRQVMVPRRTAVAGPMVRLLEESGIDLWVDEDSDATFSSALVNVFGLVVGTDES